MIVYLSGPITGVKNYEKNFAEAEAELRRQGHIVLNPAMLPPDLGDCDKYMQICLPMIDVADAVVMLEGWKNSRGACREWGYALGLDKLIVDFNEFADNESLSCNLSSTKLQHAILRTFLGGSNQ